MNDLIEVDCPACSKSMRFKRRPGSRQVAMRCPACSHFFQVPLEPVSVAAQSVVATPIQAPVAPIDEFLANPEYLRPMITSRPVIHSEPAFSPRALQITAICVAGIFMLGCGGFFAYRLVRSFGLASVASSSPSSSSVQELQSTEQTDGGSLAERAAAGDFSDRSEPALLSAASTPSRAKSSSVLNSLVAGDSSRSTASSINSPTREARAAQQQSPQLNQPAVAASDARGSGGGGAAMTSSDSATSSDGATSGAGALENLADVIERAEQSVVRIEVTSAEGDSLGSGFVVDDQGTLVTNCHVLAGALSAVAYFPNGRRCVVTGTQLIDQSRDIVIAKISECSAPAIGVAANLPRKGEQVTALGAPHGLAFTATRGIISAIRQGSEIGSEQQGTWIQVDAALSPGNSGGPLINTAGEVVGMSTLASQGSAQNLNFGISGQDIKQALATARSATTLTLAAGVGRVSMGDHEPGHGRDGGEGQIVQEAKISEQSLADYVNRGVEDFDSLLKSLRNESTRLSLELKEMKRGETYLPPALRRPEAAIARVLAPGQRTPKWYFRNETTKQDAIARQLDKIKTFTKLKTDIQSSSDSDSLYKLLWNHGPRLDLRRNNSIGYVTDLLVLHAFNDHEALVVLDDTPYILWAPSTAGMSGGELWEGPVYVAGTTTAALPEGLTTSVTVLQLVSEKQLQAAVDKVVQSSGYRTWSDRSGGFSVEAKLLGQDGSKVALQKRDGTILNVPREKLSQADVDFLAQ